MPESSKAVEAAESKREEPTNWGQIAATSLATLIVSILGGVVIFFFTNRPDPAPRLYYEQVPPTSFSTDKVQTVIQSFRVWNAGDKEAEDLQVLITIPKDSVIADQKIEPSGGAAMNVKTKLVNPSTILVTSPLLNPRESIRLAYLLNGTTEQSTKLSIRARGIVGELNSNISTEQVTPLSLRTTFAILALALVILVQFRLATFVKRYIPRKRAREEDESGETGFNNLGFRLLHKGRITEAKKYLERSLQVEPGAFALANLAHVYAVEGHFEEATAMSEIAAEYAHTPRTKAFIEYSRFCIDLLAENKSEALKHLRSSLQLTGNLASEYFDRNTNLARWKADEEINAAFSQRIDERAKRALS